MSGIRKKYFAAAGLFLLTQTAGVMAGDGSSSNSRSFFEQFVTDGGHIVWFALLPLSVVMVYLASNYVITIRRRRLVPDNSAKNICNAMRTAGLDGIVERLKNKDDLVSNAVCRSLGQIHEDRRPELLRAVAAESIEEQSLELMRKIEWANVIGNISPMIGLFGTVFGIIKAFNVIHQTASPNAEELAGGISVALVTTFWGLLVAIPALAIFGVFKNRIETLASMAGLEAEAVLDEVAIMLKRRDSAEQTEKSNARGKGGK